VSKRQQTHLFGHVSQKASLLCANTNGNHMASSGCSGPIFFVFSPGVVGRDTGSTLAALVPVVYDASTRAVVIEQVPQHAQISAPPTGRSFE
jgi:hypothetical protein